MKKQIALFLLFSICVSGYSQFEYYKSDSTRTHHMSGDFSISASPNILFNTPNGTQAAGGFKMQLFISKRFSLDADLVFGKDYIHAGPGILGIPIMLLAGHSLMGNEGITFGDGGESLTTFLFYIGAIVLSFEHISYHIPLKNETDISPYVSFLRYKSAYKTGNYSDPDYYGEQLSFASGIQINKYFGKFVLSPYAEFMVGYKDKLPGYNIGVYCGFHFPAKR
jgi:hypothetical protein